VQKQAARVERDKHDCTRFLDDATGKSSLYKEYRHNKKELARLKRLQDKAAILEEEKSF
jgi:cell shape-determining protein MreC